MGNLDSAASSAQLTPKAWFCTTPLRELPLRSKCDARSAISYVIAAITHASARRGSPCNLSRLLPTPHPPPSPRSLAPFLNRTSRFRSWLKTVLRNGAKLRREGHGDPRGARSASGTTQRDFRLAAVLVQFLIRFRSRRKSVTCGFDDLRFIKRRTVRYLGVPRKTKAQPSIRANEPYPAPHAIAVRRPLPATTPGHCPSRPAAG